MILMAIRGLALNNEVRVYAINSTDILKTMYQQFKTTPCASAALGRSLSIGALMGLMNNDQEQIYISIDGGGPLGKIHLNYLGNYQIRGYVDNPMVATIINDKNKLSVKDVVGTQGNIQVIIKNNLKQDYFGLSQIVSGEISEDFAYYFMVSEQIPSVVSAGVLVDKDESIISAGAIIFQLLPNASETSISYLENCLDKVSDLSKKLQDDPNILNIINDIFDDFLLLDEHQMSFECPCSYEDMYYKIATLAIDDLQEIKNEDNFLEAICPWCNTKYHFDEQALTAIINEKKNNISNE
jgi:molecular chaperone Hsp33